MSTREDRKHALSRLEEASAILDEVSQYIDKRDGDPWTKIKEVAEAVAELMNELAAATKETTKAKK